jgi:hypothetical protein
VAQSLASPGLAVWRGNLADRHETRVVTIFPKGFTISDPPQRILNFGTERQSLAL